MPEPLRLPVRVLVKGPSSVNWTSWMGGPRTDFTFPRVIEEQLLTDGRPCTVQAVTMTSEQAKRLLATWQREVLGFSPDVIALTYGQFESVHLFLPRWLERHANSLKAKNRRLSNLYRKLVVRPVWKSLAQVQARLDAKLPASVTRRRVRNLVADYERYVGHVQKVGSPLVLLMEVPPPSTRVLHWFPGMTARIHEMNAAVEALVKRLGKDNVRFFTLMDLIDKYADGNLDVAIPDGFHWSPEMHRAVGTKLAQEIEDWADTQPHLMPSAKRT